MVTSGMRRHPASDEALVDRLLTVPAMLLVAALVFVVTIVIAWNRYAPPPPPVPMPAPAPVPPVPLPEPPEPPATPLLPSGTFSDLPPVGR